MVGDKVVQTPPPTRSVKRSKLVNKTQQSSLGLQPQQSSLGLQSQQSSLGLQTQQPSLGLPTQQPSSGLLAYDECTHSASRKAKLRRDTVIQKPSLGLPKTSTSLDDQKVTSKDITVNQQPSLGLKLKTSKISTSANGKNAISKRKRKFQVGGVEQEDPNDYQEPRKENTVSQQSNQELQGKSKRKRFQVESVEQEDMEDQEIEPEDAIRTKQLSLELPALREGSSAKQDGEVPSGRLPERQTKTKQSSLGLTAWQEGNGTMREGANLSGRLPERHTDSPQRSVLGPETVIQEPSLGLHSEQAANQVNACARHVDSRPPTIAVYHYGARKWIEEEVNTLINLIENRISTARPLKWQQITTELGKKFPLRSKAAVYAKYRALTRKIESDVTSTNPLEGNPGSDLSEASNGPTETDTFRTLDGEEQSTPIPEEDCETDEIGKLMEKREELCEQYRTLIQQNLPPERQPLERPKFLNPKLLDLCESIIQEELTRGEASITLLNAAAYAGGLLYNKLTDELSLMHREAERKRNEEAEQVEKSLRRDISRISEYIKRRRQQVRPTARETKKFKRLAQKYPRIRDKKESQRQLEILKQRYQALKYKKEERIRATKIKRERMEFERKPSIRMEEKPKEGRLRPSAVRKYWVAILGRTKDFRAADDNLRAWTKQVAKSYKDIEHSDRVKIEETEWSKIVKQAKPWKAPGPDGIQGFWWKIWKTLSRTLRDWAEQMINTEQNPPSWFTRGRSVLLFKKGSPQDPANYRPITCLCTCYKLVTAWIANKLQDHLKRGSGFPFEQRAMKKGEWGCTHAHLLDEAIVYDSIRGSRRRGLAVAWVDYAKAYDSIPHSLLHHCLETANVHPHIRKFIQNIMTGWATTFEWKNGGRDKCTCFVQVRNGLLQGDSLSPLAFCLCVAPVSYALNRELPRVRTSEKSDYIVDLNHQFYMDDLKIYARTYEDLNHALEVVKRASTGLGLTINPSKCARAYNGVQPTAAVASNGVTEQIPVLGTQSTYKYLGIHQNVEVSYTAALDEIKHRFLEKVREIFTTNLSIGQKVKAYNSLAVPVMSYLYQNASGGARKFNVAKKRARCLDKTVRQLMREHQIRNKGSAKEYLYLERADGGGGFKSMQDLLYEVTCRNYAYLAAGPGMESVYGVLENLTRREKRTPIKDMEAVCIELGIPKPVVIDRATSRVKFDGSEYKDHRSLTYALNKRLKLTLKENRLNAAKRYVRAGRTRTAEHLNWSASCLWIKKGSVSAEVERNARAVMEGNLITKVNLKCRACHSTAETVQHIVSSCKTWVATLYVSRHNGVLRNIYYALCKTFRIVPPHYTYDIPPTTENKGVKIIYDTPMQTLSPIKHNRPDLVVFDKRRRQITIFEVRVSWYSCMKEQLRAKEYKYAINSNEEEGGSYHGRNLVGELMKLYRQKVNLIPVIIGVTGEIEKTLPSRLRQVFGEKRTWNLIERLSRSAVQGTSRIVKAHLALTRQEESEAGRNRS